MPSRESVEGREALVLRHRGGPARSQVDPVDAVVGRVVHAGVGGRRVRRPLDAAHRPIEGLRDHAVRSRLAVVQDEAHPVAVEALDRAGGRRRGCARRGCSGARRRRPCSRVRCSRRLPRRRESRRRRSSGRCPSCPCSRRRRSPSRRARCRSCRASDLLPRKLAARCRGSPPSARRPRPRSCRGGPGDRRASGPSSGWGPGRRPSPSSSSPCAPSGACPSRPRSVRSVHTRLTNARRWLSGNHFGTEAPVGTFVSRRASPPAEGDQVDLGALVLAALRLEGDPLAVGAPGRARLAALVARELPGLTGRRGHEPEVGQGLVRLHVVGGDGHRRPSARPERAPGLPSRLICQRVSRSRASARPRPRKERGAGYETGGETRDERRVHRASVRLRLYFAIALPLQRLPVQARETLEREPCLSSTPLFLRATPMSPWSGGAQEKETDRLAILRA